MSLLARLANGVRYWRVHGSRVFLWEVWRRLGSRRRTSRLPGVTATAPSGLLPLARELVRTRFTACEPLPTTIATAPAGPRVSMVTDSINAGSLFGGVGTAMILAALLAQRRHARLRIVTRGDRAHADNLDAILALYGIVTAGDVEFVFAPPGTRRPIEVAPDELFLTTSWWTTAATLGGVSADQILYLLQEDERMFYPLGDDHLQCSRVLADPRLRLAVNTSLLLQHLDATGIPGLAARALAFEPAFPASVYRRRAPAQTGAKRRLLFYARPSHLRNLFHFGLEVLDQAVTRGIVDLARWDIELVGLHIPPLRFDNGYVPLRHEGLGWQAYADLVGRTDLGLTLMYTPHPSYPPLDLAASGAVAITNRFGSKTSLERYSTNILCADLDLEAMLQAMRAGIALAEDDTERARRHAANRLATDWPQTLAPILDRFA